MIASIGLGIVVLCAAVSGCAVGQPQLNDEQAANTAATSDKAAKSEQNGAAEIKDLRFKIRTTKGDIEGILYASKVPVTAANFSNLAKRKYYDGLIFHRVIPEFMIQVGDPLTRDASKERLWGTGGPGYKFEDEFRPDLKHNKPGILSMANAGPRSNGSQIFITHVPTPHLDGKHTVFGEVTKGQDVVDKIQKGDKIIEVLILDETTALFQSQKKRIAEWNAALEKAGHKLEKIPDA